MKKIFLLVATALFAFACGEAPVATVVVENPTSLNRNDEVVEVSMSEITAKLKSDGTEKLVVLNENGKQVAYQITHDQKLIFPAHVPANGTATYTIQPGTPEEFVTRAYGRRYPERVDDIAWENDKVAFRTYGPALQATGERAFGYDVWTKSVPDMVVEERYATELNPATLARIDSLKKTNPVAAAELRHSTSYHVDHGNGLDCYKVGPTLGEGTAALYIDDEIIYPYCYVTENILDNGPLRFKVELTYNPLTVRGEENVVETRVITLDAGSHMNKTVVSYTNTPADAQVVTGIVLHEPEDEIEVVADATAGYMTYVDPTETPDIDNGKIYVGAAFPAPVKEVKPVMFGEEEAKDRVGANGHLLAISDYAPGSEYVYYWGSGWSKHIFNSPQQWNNYARDFAVKVQNPLTVTVK
ncbi:MAG: DUF4861 domain-containing protein [Bacteroides sp.]|nr:DUF4861 domain-containing protein [Bacteroides sp.]